MLGVILYCSPTYFYQGLSVAWSLRFPLDWQASQRLGSACCALLTIGVIGLQLHVGVYLSAGDLISDPHVCRALSRISSRLWTQLEQASPACFSATP